MVLPVIGPALAARANSADAGSVARQMPGAASVSRVRNEERYMLTMVKAAKGTVLSVCVKEGSLLWSEYR